MPIPTNAQATINSLNTLAHNKKTYAPKTEQTKNVRVLKRKLRTLSKKNKKWAVILGYLAAGATAAALAYAGRQHIKIPQSVITAASSASQAVKEAGASTREGLIKLAQDAKLMKKPTPVVARKWYAPKMW